jgi:hypothetical protein
MKKALVIALFCLFCRQSVVCPQTAPMHPQKVWLEIPWAPKYGIIFIDAFRKKLGNMESGNDYHKRNRFGYFGKYQFGKRALKHFGFTLADISDPTPVPGYILTRGELNQEILLSNMMFYHVKHSGRYFKYIGKIINGVKITKNGILAVAHLLGDGGVSDAFNGITRHDGNGVTAWRYFKAFENV